MCKGEIVAYSRHESSSAYRGSVGKTLDLSVADGTAVGFLTVYHKLGLSGKAFGVGRVAKSHDSIFNFLLGSYEVFTRGGDFYVDVGHIALRFGDSICLTVCVPLIADFVGRYRVFVVSHRRKFFLDVGDIGCGCVFVVESFGIELIGSKSSGEEILEFLLEEHLFHLIFKRHPIAAELESLLLVHAVFHGVECHVVESRSTLDAKLLLNHAVEIERTAAEHGIGEFGVGHFQTELLELSFVELLGYHSVEHLLLKESLVDFLTALLSLLIGLLHAALELLDVDFMTVNLGYSGSRAEECAA